jgi:hypothetical protein
MVNINASLRKNQHLSGEQYFINNINITLLFHTEFLNQVHLRSSTILGCV